MPFTVTLTTGPIEVEADDHRIEGGHHVFRREGQLMGAPRQIVVRRILLAEVLEVLAVGG